MEGSCLDERFDSFGDYSSNYDLFKQIQSEIGEDYETFPYSVLGEKNENENFITSDCLKLRKYLINFNTKENCIKRNCCQYINYFLNDMVRKNYSSDSSIFDIYITYMNHDSNNYIKSLYDAKFCKALKDFKNEFEANVDISTGECHSKIQNLLPYTNSCKEFLEKPMGNIASSEQQTAGLVLQVASEISDQQKAEQNVRSMADNSTSFSSTVTTLPISLISSGFGVLLIFLSFYKFTPLGHWLRLRTHGFEGISENLDGENYEMKHNNSEYNDENIEYNEYNISYNSL
ncbi:PIR Superfamily Protein [Plasmodium ovale curtisi]|uniref:PIR Superfamily Protein n=1 Tax=Plasmodium ovale curtisi TaxID=864141 RepID=A0A1A8X443_PLAOA|nr:PIR Superfamily Protein [Plasmodium ovale curtisi]